MSKFNVGDKVCIIKDISYAGRQLKGETGVVIKVEEVSLSLLVNVPGQKNLWFTDDEVQSVDQTSPCNQKYTYTPNTECLKQHKSKTHEPKPSGSELRDDILRQIFF